MSRAFVKEDDGSAPEVLPDLPQSPHPNYVTPSGLKQLQSRLEEAKRHLAEAAGDADQLEGRLPRAAAERDIRFWQERLRRAQLIDPAAQPHNEVAFGAAVLVVNENDEERRYRIVGEDEADAAVGKVSYVSPLAKALLGQEAGDVVLWQRPDGDIELEILSFDYPRE
jgi:transcription elongation GreA/GreB family factor